MSAASDALQTQIAEFGASVTHRPRSGSSFDVSGIFSQEKMTPLTDNREGRTNGNTGTLLILNTKTDGTSFTLDDQGEFTIDGQRWTIANASSVDGGYVITLKLTDRKTVRHLPGNS